MTGKPGPASGLGNALPGLAGEGALRPPGGRARHGSLGQLAASREAVSYLKLGAHW